MLSAARPDEVVHPVYQAGPEADIQLGTRVCGQELVSAHLLFECVDAGDFVQPNVVYVADETAAIHRNECHVVNMRCGGVPIAVAVTVGNCAVSSQIIPGFRDKHLTGLLNSGL